MDTLLRQAGLGDRIGEQASGGADTVVPPCSSYTLAANLEQLAYNGGKRPSPGQATRQAPMPALTGGERRAAWTRRAAATPSTAAWAMTTITVDNGGDQVFGGGKGPIR